jgi:hypothetical protein
VVEIYEWRRWWRRWSGEVYELFVPSSVDKPF